MNIALERKTVEYGHEVVSKDAYKDYKEISKIRNPKKIKSDADYKRITRKIWRRVAQDATEYEGGVYARNVFYIVPQVIDNVPYVTLPYNGGWISPMNETKGDMYTILYVNLMRDFKHHVWTMDYLFKQYFRKRFARLVRKLHPKYTFFLNTILRNKL